MPTGNDNSDAEPSSWEFTPEQHAELHQLIARETEFELHQLSRDFGTEPPWDEYAVEAAMNRLSCNYAMSKATMDGRLFTAWLLRRYYRRISPTYVRRRGLLGGLLG